LLAACGKRARLTKIILAEISKDTIEFQARKTTSALCWGFAPGSRERRPGIFIELANVFGPFCHLDVNRLRSSLIKVAVKMTAKSIGYSPCDPRREQPELDRVMRSTRGVSHRSQLGVVGQALYDAGCRMFAHEAALGDVLEAAISMVGRGDTLVIYDAIHASGCSISRLRKLKRTVERVGGKLMVLRVGDEVFLDWAQCEAVIHRVCIECAKKNGRYKAGAGRPRKLDLEDARKLRESGLAPEQIAERLGISRPTVYRALGKLKAVEAAAV
jgi:hypothetical protein